jgi:hypothetical protein
MFRVIGLAGRLGADDGAAAVFGAAGAEHAASNVVAAAAATNPSPTDLAVKALYIVTPHGGGWTDEPAGSRRSRIRWKPVNAELTQHVNSVDLQCRSTLKMRHSRWLSRSEEA